MVDILWLSYIHSHTTREWEWIYCGICIWYTCHLLPWLGWLKYHRECEDIETIFSPWLKILYFHPRLKISYDVFTQGWQYEGVKISPHTSTGDGKLLIGPLGTKTSVKFYSEFKHFHSTKCTWKCRLRNGVHFVSARMCWIYNPFPIPCSYNRWHSFSPHNIININVI